MLQNAKVTAFTVSQLLRENQQGGGVVNYPPSQSDQGKRLGKGSEDIKILTFAGDWDEFQKKPQTMADKNYKKMLRK